MLRRASHVFQWGAKVKGCPALPDATIPQAVLRCQDGGQVNVTSVTDNADCDAWRPDVVICKRFGSQDATVDFTCTGSNHSQLAAKANVMGSQSELCQGDISTQGNSVVRTVVSGGDISSYGALVRYCRKSGSDNDVDNAQWSLVSSSQPCLEGSMSIGTNGVRFCAEQSSCRFIETCTFAGGGQSFCEQIYRVQTSRVGWSRSEYFNSNGCYNWIEGVAMTNFNEDILCSEEVAEPAINEQGADKDEDGLVSANVTLLGTAYWLTWAYSTSKDSCRWQRSPLDFECGEGGFMRLTWDLESADGNLICNVTRTNADGTPSAVRCTEQRENVGTYGLTRNIPLVCMGDTERAITLSARLEAASSKSCTTALQGLTIWRFDRDRADYVRYNLFCNDLGQLLDSDLPVTCGDTGRGGFLDVGITGFAFDNAMFLLYPANFLMEEDEEKDSISEATQRLSLTRESFSVRGWEAPTQNVFSKGGAQAAEDNNKPEVKDDSLI